MRYHIETKKYQYFVGNMPNLGGRSHIHTHLELVYICGGRAAVTVDGQEYPLLPGDLSLAFPNQLHFYRVLEPVNVFLVIFSPDMHPQLTKLLSGHVPACPVLKQQDLPEDTEQRLRALHQNYRSKTDYDRMNATGQLLSFLAEVLPAFSYVEDPADYDAMRRILKYCADHYLEPVSLDTAAQALYLNKYYISHMFQKRTGFTFNTFIGSLRIDHACRLMEQGVSVSEAALSASFSTVRTFNRVFLKHLHMPPREYLRIQKEKPTK